MLRGNMVRYIPISVKIPKGIFGLTFKHYNILMGQLVPIF